jgi:hypothetical protein
MSDDEGPTYAEDPDAFPPHPGCGMDDCQMDHEWWPNQTLQFAEWLVRERAYQKRNRRFSSPSPSSDTGEEK